MVVVVICLRNLKSCIKINNKMAEKNSRFAERNEISIQGLKENAKNLSTTQSTNNWLKVFQSWAVNRGNDRNIENYTPEELNKILEVFYAEVRKQNGEDYEPDSLRVMITSLDRYLKEKGYKASIIRDREFAESKQVLEGKAKLLRQNGKGKRPHKSQSLTAQEEKELWEFKSPSTYPNNMVAVNTVFRAQRSTRTPQYEGRRFPTRSR